MNPEEIFKKVVEQTKPLIEKANQRVEILNDKHSKLKEKIKFVKNMIDAGKLPEAKQSIDQIMSEFDIK